MSRPSKKELLAIPEEHLEDWLVGKKIKSSVLAEWMVLATRPEFSNKSPTWWEAWLKYSQTLPRPWSSCNLISKVLQDNMDHVAPTHPLWSMMKAQTQSSNSEVVLSAKDQVLELMQAVARHHRVDCVHVCLSLNPEAFASAISLWWGKFDLIQEMLKDRPLDREQSEVLSNYMRLSLDTHHKKTYRGVTTVALNIPADWVGYIHDRHQKSLMLSAWVAGHEKLYQASQSKYPVVLTDLEKFEHGLHTQREDIFDLFPSLRFEQTHYAKNKRASFFKDMVFKTHLRFAQQFFKHHPHLLPSMLDQADGLWSRVPVHSKCVFVASSWETQNKYIYRASTDSVKEAWRLARWSTHDPASFKVDFPTPQEREQWRLLIDKHTKRHLRQQISIPSSSEQKRRML